MGRSPCCEKAHTNKGAWTKEEDMLLISYIRAHGEGCWRSLPKAAGLQRCGKSCRLRWINYLRPDLKRGNFSEEEDEIIIELHSQFGNKWSLIASHLPGRTDNEIKNYWNTHIKRKLAHRGRSDPPPLTRQLVGNAPEHVSSCSSGSGSGSGSGNGSATVTTQTEQQVIAHRTGAAPETPTSVANGSSTSSSQVDVGLNLDLSIGLPWDSSYTAATLVEQEVVAAGQEKEEKVGLPCGHTRFERGGEGCNLCGYPRAFRCYI